MHPEARRWVEVQAIRYGPFHSVLEVGSRYINGGVRDLFNGNYLGVDIAEGPGVDVVADAADWLPNGKYSLVVCCEVLEHAEEWPRIVERCLSVLAPSGWFMFTMAGEGRAPHSAVDGGAVRAGEYYANITESALSDALSAAGAKWWQTDTSNPGDLYAVGQA